MPGTHSTLGAEKTEIFVCFEVIKRSDIVYNIESSLDYVNLYPNEFTNIYMYILIYICVCI